MEIKDNVVRVQIGNVFPNPWNPNRQSDFIYERELESIRRFGMLDPVTVRQVENGYEIIDGEHRWKACKELGMGEIPVNNLGQVPDTVAKQLTIVFNETKGKADRVDLSSLLKEISLEIPAESLFQIMPFPKTDLAALLSTDAIDWNTLSSQAPSTEQTASGEEIVTVSYKLPKGIAEAFKAQVDRFKTAILPTQAADKTSPIQAIEAITAYLEKISEEQLASR